MYCRLGQALVIGGGIWLTGCGGGGGNGALMPTSSQVSSAQFTSFSAVKSGQPVQASGISQTVSATTAGTGTVTSTSISGVDAANSSATLTYGVIPAMTAFSFSAPTSSVTYSGSGVDCKAGTGVCGGSSSNTQAVVINPLDPQVPAIPQFAWNYQSFGHWALGRIEH